MSACLRSDADLCKAVFNNDAVTAEGFRNFVADLACNRGHRYVQTLVDMMMSMPDMRADLEADNPFIRRALNIAIKEEPALRDRHEVMQLMAQACRQEGVWASEFEVSLIQEVLEDPGIKLLIVTVDTSESFHSRDCKLETTLVDILGAVTDKEMCIVLLRLEKEDHYQYVTLNHHRIISVDDLWEYLEQFFESSSADGSEDSVASEGYKSDQDELSEDEILRRQKHRERKLHWLKKINEALQVEKEVSKNQAI